jgi:hypothetical protein
VCVAKKKKINKIKVAERNESIEIQTSRDRFLVLFIFRNEREKENEQTRE